ncbi:helix-turn-helix domain-containing protein [Rhodopseudomonas palustris]|nr:helix-turn-helix domain-containing protein [Rhodopseudomonas palustris]
MTQSRSLSVPLRPARFSTAGLPEHDRFDAWREYLRPVADLTPVAHRARTAAIDLAAWDLGSFAMCQERSSGTRFSRTTRRVKTVFADHWYLFLIKEGANWVVSDGGCSAEQVSRGAAGQVGFYSLGEAFHGEMQPMDILMLFIPRDLFARQAGTLDRLNNTIIDTARGRLLSDYMLALERRLPELTQDEVPAIVRATEAMVAACLAPAPHSAEEAREGIILSLGERARRVVQSRLSDPKLTPASLANSIGVSRSALYRLFEPHGGAARYVRNTRLAAAHRALCDLAETRQIQQIADSFGFTCAQEFSRAFRQRYGYSPSELRADCGQSVRRLSSQAAEGGRTLGEFLRTTA